MLRPSGPKKSVIDNFIFVLIALSILVIGVGLVLIFFSKEVTEGGLFGSGEMEQVDFTTLEIEPGQNHYLACHQDFCQNSTPDEITETYPVSTHVLRDRLTSFVDSQERIEVKTLDLENLKFVFFSYAGVDPFPDVITVKIHDLEGENSGLSILSQTLKGEDTSGRNKQRVQSWLKILKRP